MNLCEVPCPLEGRVAVAVALLVFGYTSILKIRDDVVEHGSNGGSNFPLRHTKIKFADELSPVRYHDVSH